MPPVVGDQIDLDNLVQKAIIPAVHDILKPPTIWGTFWRSLLEARPDDLIVIEALKQYRNITEVHVVGYEVLGLERLDDDLLNGSVELLFRDGEPRTCTWTLLEEALEHWKDHVEGK